MFLNWRGYILGIALVAIVTLIKYFAQPSIIPPEKMILYMLAIVLTAIFFGFVPSILATILSVLAYDFFFVPPLHTLGATSIQEIDIWVIFLLVGVIISYLSSNLRRENQIAAKEILTRKKAEAELINYQEHLGELVKQRTSELEKANLDLKQEISERKRAEEALIKAKEDLERRVKERTRELEQANEQLKQYGRRITQVQEDERKRIAYELHDDTAQYLAILKLQIDSLLQSDKIQAPEILEKLQYLKKDAGRAVEDIRRYSHELRPGVLDHLGLQAALEQIAEDTNKVKQIAVEVNVEGEEPKMPDEVKLGLFRIAQEVLNNCRKHAKASKAIISLRFKDSKIEMAVSDNGVGFDVQEAASRSGLKGSLGLMSMQERAQLIGANLRIESKPGQGTTVYVNKTTGD